MKIGFVGLGHMGGAMAANLARAGHALTVYNRTAAKAQPLVALGATAAKGLADLAAAEIVISMLSDDAAVAETVLGKGGLLAILPEGALHVSMSTVSVELSKTLAQAHRDEGQGFLAAPVFGRPEAAEAGKLFIVAGGPDSAIAKAKPAFEAMGQRLFVLGAEPWQANLVKLSGNFLIAAVIEALGEAMALIGKGGIDRHQYLELLTSTLFAAPVYKTYGGLIADAQFEPAGFAATLGLKDIRLGLAAGEALQVPLPLASLLRDRFLTLLAQGGAHLDWSAIGALAAKDSGQAG